MLERRFFYLSVFIALFLILAAVSLPVRGSTATSSLPERRAAVEKAVSWFQAQQATDGSIGGQNTGKSCEVAFVVATAGEDPDAPAWTPEGVSLLDACERDVPIYLARRDSGRMGKVLRAVVAASADPHDFGGLDLIAEIEGKYDPAIGLYDPIFLFRQDLAILALDDAGRPIPDAVLPALLAQQRPTGGWGWAVEPDPEDGFNDEGDLDTTARTLQVIRALGLSLNHPAYIRAVEFITDLQNPDGGWGDNQGPTNTNSTALAIEGLLAGGWDPEAPPYIQSNQTPVQTLLTLQEESGAFIYRVGGEESRLMATIDAVPALLHTYPGDIPKTNHLYLPILIATQ